MEYPKIETLYERDEKTHKVKPGVFKNRTYMLLKEWEFTEKIDGTNIRCIWEPPILRFNGRTENAQIHADLIRWLYENVSKEKLQEVFPDVSVVLFGEGYGAGIQKGGNYSPTKKLILFDVLVDGKWWLSWENVKDVAVKLGLDTVPYLGKMSVEQATDLVRTGFKSRLGDGTADAEGIVGRPAETLFDKKGHRLILKLKTKDF
ncbi:hypothetical protein LCGC14_2681780 [marine sediment metagenome]|uniref:RNA ligase domain-containing protein n=1 Tax=marine sediment metagenome TaxID=412755 RepID=A0A0F9A8N9_9ZZZZ